MTKIMVAGAASGYTKQQVELARTLGLEIAEASCTLVNGATTGLPWEAAESARSLGGRIIAISPAVGLEQHRQLFSFPEYPTDELKFAGFQANITWMQRVEGYLTGIVPDAREEQKKQFFLKFRNPISVGISDAVIAIGGRIGTINELTIASDMAKPIGIVQGGGGTSEQFFPELVDLSGKQKALILVLPPTELVDQILKTLEV